jgi:hypothetical protein
LRRSNRLASGRDPGYVVAEKREVELVTEMTTAAILWASLATRRRQATMTISLNPLRSTTKSAQIDVISSATE